jgi:hypothetical protein
MHLTEMRLQEEVRSACLALAEAAPGEECLKEALGPCLDILLVGHVACCLAAR